MNQSVSPKPFSQLSGLH